MSDAPPEQLGPPSVKLNAFQLWIHSRQFPEAHDQWDGNWLNVTAHCGQSGGSVWATGAILDLVGIVRFRNELERLYKTLSGEAVLESHEPNVKVRVTPSDGVGHLSVRAEITPDHLAQGHWFEFELDQSYLPQLSHNSNRSWRGFQSGEQMAERVSLEGPVEMMDGELVVLIPLEAGGAALAPFATGIGEIDGEFLKVVVQPWLAEKLRIGAGSLVIIDNANGKFTITRSAANDEPAQ